MKSPFKHVIAGLVLAIPPCPVSAADVSWDTTPGVPGPGNGTLTGGPGTWNITNGNWTTDAGATNIAWINGPDVAVFSGAAGAVDLGIPITAGGLVFNSDGYSVTGNTLTLAGAPVITVGTGFFTTISSVIAGTVGLTKSGLGTLNLTSPNTHTGATTVSNGVLGLTGNRTASSGALIAGNVAAQSGTLAISAGNFSTGTGDIQVGAAAGSVGIVQQTGGTLATGSTSANNGRVLIGAATPATGTYHLSGGSLTANATGTTGLNNANVLVLGTNNNSTATFNLSGTGTLVVPQTFGYLQISRSNSSSDSISGTFNQTGGTAAISYLGMGGPVNSNGISNLDVTAGSFSVTTGFATMAAGAGSTAAITIGGTAIVTLPEFPTIRGSNASATLTFDGGTLRPAAASNAYIGGLTEATIQDGGATIDVPTARNISISQNLLAHPTSTGGGLHKTGAGILTLSGFHTYTGPTVVAAGSLVLTGEIHSNSQVTVANGATLGGSGSAAGTVTSPGTLAPAGTLATGPADLTGGTLAIKVNGDSAGRLLSSGTIHLSGTSLDVSEVNSGSAVSYVIAEGANITGTFSPADLPSGYSLTYTATKVILNLALVVVNYPTWSSVNGLDATNNGPAMDPDNDGTNNLMEYVLGGLPVGTGAGDTSILPSPALDETYLYFQFERTSVSADDTIQSVALSGDLTNWNEFTSIGSSSEGAVTISENGEKQFVSVAVPRSRAVDGKLFARLEVDANFPIVGEVPGFVEISRHWAPVIYHAVRENTDFGRQLHAARDAIVSMNFDGDFDVANNWHNSRYQPGQQGHLADRLTPPLHGKAYCGVVESEAFFFITYGFYHSGQDSFFSAARHQNDWEAIVLAVRKDGSRYGKLEGMMTQFHTDQFSYLPSEIKFSGHRPIIYIEPNGGLEGHGIKAYTNQNPGSNGLVYVPGSSSENVTSTTLATSGNWNTAPRCQYKLIPISEMWGLIGRTGLNDPYSGWKVFNYARAANYPSYDHEPAGGNPPWDRDFFMNPFVFFSANFPALQPELADDSYVFNPYLNGASTQSGPNNPNGVLPSPGWQKSQLGGTSGYAWTHRGETTLYHRNSTAADDRLTFNHVNAGGDFSIQGRIHSVQDITNSRAGLMIRNSTADTSRMIGLLVSPGQQVLLQYRTSDGAGLSTIVAGPMPATDQPVWLRLERKGGDLVASYSYQEFGGQFTVLATVPIPMDDQVVTGMAMRSSNATYFSTATMTHIEVQSTP